MDKNKNYATLDLYIGLSQITMSMGIAEGGFSTNKKDEYSKSRFNKATQVIHRALDPNLNGWVFVGRDIFVKNEEKAEKVIYFAEKNIVGASGGFYLHSCVHGNVKFIRNIRFNDWKEDSATDLVNILKSSGIESKYNSRNYVRDSKEHMGWNSILRFH